MEPNVELLRRQAAMIGTLLQVMEVFGRFDAGEWEAVFTRLDADDPQNQPFVRIFRQLNAETHEPPFMVDVDTVTTTCPKEEM